MALSASRKSGFELRQRQPNGVGERVHASRMLVGTVANAVRDVGEGDAGFGVGPADAAAEARVAEDAFGGERAERGRRGATLVDAEAVPPRSREGTVVVGRGFESRHRVDGRLREDARSLEFTVVGQTGVEPSHIPGRADPVRGGDDRSMDRLGVERCGDPRVVAQTLVGVATAVERVEGDERGDVVGFVLAEPDPGVRHSEGIEHALGDEVLDSCARDAPDEFADQPAERERVVCGLFAGRRDRFRRLEFLDDGPPIGPQVGAVVEVASREAGRVAEHLPDGYLALFGVGGGELRPMVDHPVVVTERAVVDERVERDRGVRFRTGKQQVARRRRRRLAPRPGRSAGEVEDALLVDVDGQLGAVVEADLEVAVEESGDTLPVVVPKRWHTPYNRRRHCNRYPDGRSTDVFSLGAPTAGMDRKEFRDLASPAEAHEAIRSLSLEGGVDRVPLADARGRVLVARLDAELDVPGFDRASLDGYALRARDTFGADEADPAELELAGEVHAGEEPDVTVGEGEAVEISTGAVMPTGADAMVPVERTTPAGSTVQIRTSVAPGDNVMFAGADVAAGERALGPGTRITPRDIGLLSALGIDEVPVRAKPTVGIVSTGDELVRPGSELVSDRGEIYDVNSYTIAAGVEDAGGEAVLYPHAGDDQAEMERVLREAAEECDLVLSSGSTSASAVDVIYRVIDEQGELLLHGVSVKPGKPMLVGRLNSSAYVGLPGYPVSAMMVFRTFVAPAIREAAGLPETETATIEGTMARQERYDEGRLRLMPVGVVESGNGETLVYPVDKGSGATTSLAEADGVVEVDPDTDYLETGESVTVSLFSPDVRPPTLLGVGEDDPELNRLLDGLDNPRYLSVGSRPGLRRLREGVPDVAVVAGPLERSLDAEELGGWDREWGLLVKPGNPDAIEGLVDLVDDDLRFVNRTTDSGLRSSLEAAVDALADERDVDRRDLVDSITGFDLGLRAHESPPRKVIADDADAALGLRKTAARLDLEFVSLGHQPVRVLANPDRLEKAGVRELEAALGELSGDR
jgi:molybdenum cofactor synthesis domain-containing protein